MPRRLRSRHIPWGDSRPRLPCAGPTAVWLVIAAPLTIINLAPFLRGIVGTAVAITSGALISGYIWSLAPWAHTPLLTGHAALGVAAAGIGAQTATLIILAALRLIHSKRDRAREGSPAPGFAPRHLSLAFLTVIAVGGVPATVAILATQSGMGSWWPAGWGVLSWAAYAYIDRPETPDGDLATSDTSSPKRPAPVEDATT
jgi:hypothetical protein